MRKIGRIVRVQGDALDRLRFHLCRFAEPWFVEGQEVQIELPYRDRIKWISTEIIRPAKHLLASIDFDNHARFAMWQHPSQRNWAGLLLQLDRDLGELIKCAEELVDLIQSRRQDGMKDITGFKHSLVLGIAFLYVKLFPTRRPKRVHHQGYTEIQNEFAEFVRLVAEPILGKSERLDREIQFAVKEYSSTKKPETAAGRKIHKS
jgi:hypothetical protein